MAEVARRHGDAAARSLQQATYDAVDEVGRAAAEAGIDAGFHKGGGIRLARGPQGVPALEHSLREYERFGFGDRYRLLDAAELRDRIRVAGAVRALVGDGEAVIHPGRLVRGLARAVERQGTTILEGTRVTGFRPRDESGLATLTTATGLVRAPVIVLAGEAWLTQLAPLHRQLVPLYSLIVLTEPLTDAQWAEIGWAGREVVASTRLSIDYLSRTEDGRVLFGGRGAPYRFGSPIRPGVRPARPDARAPARLRPRVVPGAARRPSSPTPGAGRWACRATGTRRSRSTRRRGSRARAATSATACRRRTSRGAC